MVENNQFLHADQHPETNTLLPTDNQSVITGQRLKTLLPYIGAVMAILSSLCFSLCSLIVKVLNHVDPLQLSAVRFIGILMPTLSIVIYVQEPPLGPRKKWGFLVLRALSGALSLMMQFYAFRHMPLSDASVIIFSAPIFVTVLARIFLKEVFNVFNVIMTLTTIIGVVFITKPPFLFGDNVYKHGYSSEMIITTVIALFGTLFNANVYVLLRYLKGVHYAVIMFTFSIIAIILSTVATFLFGTTCIPMCGTDRQLIVLLAVLSFGGQVLLTKSLQFEQAGPVSIYRSADIVFAFIWQIVFLNETPNVYSITGAIFVTTSVILTGVRKWFLSKL